MLSKYNTVWDTPSKDSFDSMPLSGSGGAGANIWCQDGSLWFYIAHNGAYDKKMMLLKLGCIKIDVPGLALVQGNKFKQELNLQKGEIIIDWASDRGAVRFKLFYIGENLVCEALSNKEIELKITVASWRNPEIKPQRYNDKIIWKYVAMKLTNRLRLLDGKIKAKQNKSIEFIEYGDGILAVHKNNGCAAKIIDKREFGMYITDGQLMTDFTAEKFVCQTWKGVAVSTKRDKKTRHVLVIATAGKNCSHLKQNANKIICDLENLKALEEKRWEEFWNRSYIYINTGRGEKDAGFQVGKNYQLFRYMTACNRGGEIPLKFNGGIFTTEPRRDRINHEIESDAMTNFAIDNKSPDYRRWGKMFMSQNQRWLGWCALMSGDYDLISTNTKFYRDTADVARMRAKSLGASGACYVEPLNLDGTCNVAPTKIDTCAAPHLNHHFCMALEHAYMTMLSHSFLGVNIEVNIPWIIDSIRFFDTHYRKENKKLTGSELTQGKLVIYPCSGLELCGNAKNPVETVAGLIALTGELLKYGGLSANEKSYVLSVKSILPNLPFTTYKGDKIIALAESYETLYNPWEMPEFYLAFPYRMLGAWSEGDKKLLQDTWNSIEPRGEDTKAFYAKMDFSWQSQVANMACMGDKEKAKERVIYKLADKENTARFTAFFGPGNDWIPDHNWGGSGLVGLQTMILQEHDGEIFIGEGFPQDWECSFKLHTNGKKIVEGRIIDGKKEILTNNERAVSIKLITKLACKFIIKRGIKSTDYFSYCDEMGCGIWNILEQVPNRMDDVVFLILPDKLISEGFSKVGCAVEVPLKCNSTIPEGCEVIEFSECTMLCFQGSPYEDENWYEHAHQEVNNAVSNYAPELYGLKFAYSDAPEYHYGASAKRGCRRLVPVGKI